MSLNDESHIKMPQVIKMTNNNTLDYYYFKFPGNSKDIGVLTNDGTGILQFVQNSNNNIESYILKDEKKNGTNGGSFKSGDWRTRDLNNIYKIPSSSDNVILNLEENTFTLSKGSYIINAKAPAYKVDNHKIRLLNYTDNLVICYGTTESTEDKRQVMTHSCIEHNIVIEENKTFKIEHKCKKSREGNNSGSEGEDNGDGFGIAAGLADKEDISEIYTTVSISKI